MRQRVRSLQYNAKILVAPACPRQTQWACPREPGMRARSVHFRSRPWHTRGNAAQGDRMEDRDAGDPQTWLAEHGAVLYKYALLHLRDPQRAEEAVQETLLAALEARGRFAGQSSPRTWLIGILKHKILDLFRREAREIPLDEAIPPTEEDPILAGAFEADGHWREKSAEWDDPAVWFARKEFLAVLQRCVDGLPPRLARVFLLREVMEEDGEKICQELAITPTNLWAMLYRARVGLRRCLDRNGFGPAARNGIRK